MSSTSSRSSTPLTGVSKLPPIITNEADREFLYQINGFIDKEMAKIKPKNEDQRYLIYKAVFNKIIEHVTAYKYLLTTIKKEYEDTIEAIRTAQQKSVFLQGKLKAMASEPSTIRNYKKRCDELEERIAIVKKDNERLIKELLELKAEREVREKKPEEKQAPVKEVKKDSRRIPGLTLEESTDISVLNRKFDQLDRQLKELNISLKTRFLPKTQKLQLKDTLDKKVSYRDQLLWQSQVYKARGQKLEIALEAAQAYNRVKPPHQTVGDAVILAFQHAMGTAAAAEKDHPAGGDGVDNTPSETAHSSTFEDDDPNKEKEAEVMLEYIEKFNELFEDDKFEEAAIHAANSPKGILRTQATLAKFRDVTSKYGGRSPLMAFCDALMSSVKATIHKPNEGLSLDCVKAGLEENRLDLVCHWLAQDRLTVTGDMGHLIEDHCSCQVPCMCGGQALAQNVFMRMHMHMDSAMCLVRQGKANMALQHAKEKGVLSSDFLLFILKHYPSLQLLELLFQGDCTLKLGGSTEQCGHASSNGVTARSKTEDSGISGKGTVLPLGVTLTTLKKSGHWHLAEGWLQRLVYDHHETGKFREILQKAVLEDDVTTSREWNALIKMMHDDGLEDLSLQLMAVVIVATSLKSALKAHQASLHMTGSL